MRGPYVQGQMVYMYRRQGRGTAKGMLATRHGAWIGPGRIIGMESSRNGPIPRLVWVSYNGYLYRCSPEGLRPLPDDEAAFRQLTRELSLGQLSPDLERASESLREKAGQFIDLLPDKPQDEDMELEEDFNDDDDDDPDPPDDLEGGPRKIRRRISRSDEYWRKRAAGAQPLGVLHEGPQPRIARAMSDLPDPTAPSDEAAHDEKRRRVTIDPEIEVEQYEPTTPADTPKEMPGTPVDSPDQPMSEDALPDIEIPQQPVEDQAMDDLQKAIEVPVPDDEDLMVSGSSNVHKDHVLEVSMNVLPEDITENPLCLWEVLDQCLMVTPKAKQRRVEVNLRKLSPHDRKLFEGAMQKEWNSWIENKVTSICKSRGIPPKE